METTARFLINAILIGTLACVALWGGAAKAQNHDPVLGYFQANAEKNITPTMLITAMEIAKAMPDNHPKKAYYLAFIPQYHQEQFGRPIYQPQTNVFGDISNAISSARSGLRSPSTIADPAPQYRCKPWGSRGEMRCEAQ